MLKRYKRKMYLGLLIIAIGAVILALTGERTGSLGIIFIAIGGLLTVSALKKRNAKTKPYKDTGQEE